MNATTRKTGRTGSQLLSLAVLVILAFAWGCGADDALIGDPVPNTPPDTEVTGFPPVLSETGFEVTFYWKGSDEDGEVVGFEWRISDNGADMMIDPEDTLEADLPWTFTTATDTTFTVTANLDSFQIDVDDPNQGPRNYRYWQTHTLFVRAVDDRGAVDPRPANVSFTATTIAPRVQIDLPVWVPSATCRQSAKVLTFGWTGVDPDVLSEEPTEVRYLLLPAQAANGDCLTRTQYEGAPTPFITNDDPNWSDWLRYDAAQDSGRVVTLPRQEANKKFLFAVQARDVAGAVTPTFEWGVNVRHIETSDGKFPRLLVTEQFLGAKSWIGEFGVDSKEVVSNQPLEFTWQGDASEYAGIVEAYRYGWDLVDPDDPNDPGWAVPWGNGPNWRRAPIRSFNQGSHNFVVQCRDNSGTISRGFYNLQVIQIPDREEQRPLLLVDDYRTGNTDSEIALEALWDSEWEDMLVGRVQGFQPGDILDAATEVNRVSFRTVAEYQGVIWFTSPNQSSFFHTRLAPVSNIQPQFNWLEVYQARVGNVFFVGPGSMANSVEEAAWVFPMVFNVPAPPPRGFGTELLPSGNRINRGISRYPYTAWCLDIVDSVRPAIGFIWGEDTQPGILVRSKGCDNLSIAELDDDFLSTYPDAGPPSNVRTLMPVDRRFNQLSGYQFNAEEIYNRNGTTRELNIEPQADTEGCLIPMYRWVARRDDPAVGVAFPDSLCFPPNRPTSTLDGGLTGIVSTVYSDTKQLSGSEDFLWGFNPLAFDKEAVNDAVLWILRNRWELPVQ